MKNTVYTLTTPYEERLGSGTPHSYYPRPSLVRKSYLSLNGKWDFGYSKSKEKYPNFERTILVPFPPESRLSGIFEAVAEDDYIFYRRSFTLPEGFIKGRLIIHFGAVDEVCELYINGRKIGEHEGGYLPFSFDITEAIETGENEIVLIARDTLSHKYPWGKQKRNRGGMWYTPVSGIWQSVWLESVPLEYVHRIKIDCDMNQAEIAFFGTKNEAKITLIETGEEFFGTEKVTVSPKNPIPWTPENPHLYRFKAECGEDSFESYFALREIGYLRDGDAMRLTLNRKPYIFNGLLDQGYYPDGIYLPATVDGYRDDILLAKRLGFNMLRKHIKVEPEIFYALCDELGMAVFQDMVNNSDYSFIRDTVLPTFFSKRRSDKNMHKDKETRKIFIDNMKLTMEHLYNFPCILYYTIFNEGWGQFCADEVYKIAKECDKKRIIDATSGWFTENLSDVDSHHIYFKKISCKPRPERPLVISEFGGYSLRISGHLFGDKNYGYKTFKTENELTEAIENLYLTQVLPLAEAGASAFVYTELSDIEDETNGFITYDRRKVKVDADRIKNIMDKVRSAAKKGEKNQI